jgi:hypothetical protein
VVGSTDFLPYLVIGNPLSKAVQDDKLEKGNLGFVDGANVTDLGKSCPMLFLARRPCARDFSGEQPVSVFNVKDPEFERIKNASELKGSQCSYGPEYLVWVPSLRRFGLFFFGSKTARNEARSIDDAVKKGPALFLMSSHLIETPKYKWYSATPSSYAVPVDLPTAEDNFGDVIQKFKNPPSPGEIVEAPSDR